MAGRQEQARCGSRPGSGYCKTRRVGFSHSQYGRISRLVAPAVLVGSTAGVFQRPNPGHGGQECPPSFVPCDLEVTECRRCPDRKALTERGFPSCDTTLGLAVCVYRTVPLHSCTSPLILIIASGHPPCYCSPSAVTPHVAKRRAPIRSSKKRGGQVALRHAGQGGSEWVCEN